MRLLIAVVLVACGGNDNECPGPLADGDPDGAEDPLAAGAEARAGRIRGADLPVVRSGLATWREGDFVLANDRVAIVIEDVGDSDLYDPWGGRPVGVARIEAGADGRRELVEPANFGELFLLTGRSTIVTESVTVIADGSDGGTAIVRARGKLHPVPFFEAIIAGVYNEAWLDVEAAIDYELAPGAEHVDIRYRFASPRTEPEEVPSVMHAFMYTKRTPVFEPSKGFGGDISGSPWIGLIDEGSTSWAYIPGDGTFGPALSVSGFLGSFGDGFEMPACGELERLHAQIVIGGRGTDGIQASVARVRGEAQREIAGTVTRDGVPVAGIHVHAIDDTTDAYLTRAVTDATGAYVLHVPAAASVRLDAVRIGEPIVSVAGDAPEIAMPPLGRVHVTAAENGTAVPVRVQVFPAAGQMIDEMPDRYGEAKLPDGRLLVEFATRGEITLEVPPGQWRVVVSRGYEYELVEQTVTVVAGAMLELDAIMDRSVATTGEQCADFHIHTWRSNDSGDDASQKLAQAVADGLELPVRSEHEFVDDFGREIEELGVGAFATGLASIELTSFEVWGHMGVFPLVPDPTRPNGGAPQWQTFPTATDPDREFATLAAPTVFDTVRERPERPLVIINHPRGGANYFDYVGFDPATGMADRPEEFDTKFTLVEVFNDSDWVSNRNGNVRDWFGLLRSGRRVFAVGSSDSHEFSGSPVGYPRTCITLGTDDPKGLTTDLVRDRLAAGQSTISGGIFVTARIGIAGPGETVTGAGAPMMVQVTVRAATWVDVDAIDVVVDGETVDSIPIMPGDVDPDDPTIRYDQLVPIQTAATGGFVVIAAHGDQTLEPVHRNRVPFGVTNPIFVVP